MVKIKIITLTKMTFIYYSLPGYGHVNPTLNVVRELVMQGHKVIYYSTEQFKSYIESAGVTFRNYNFKTELDGTITRDASRLFNMLAKFSEQNLADFLKEASVEKPDCIMHDSLALWGKIIAQNMQLPAVCFITTYAYNKKTFFTTSQMYLPMIKHFVLSGYTFLQAYSIYTSLAWKYHARLNGPGDMLMSKEKLNIVFSTPDFQPQAKSFSSTFHFVGPSIYPRPEKDDFLKHLPTENKLIYISYGTLVNDNLSFYKTCIEAFRDTSYTIILSLGARFKPSDLPKTPKNIIIRSYVNQLAILEKAALFITHAGMNSVTEGLYYGVPMVLIPDTHEQAFNAHNVEKAGAGMYLKKEEFTSASLLEATQQVLADPNYVKSARRIQKSFQKAGGWKTAAQKIASYV